MNTSPAPDVDRVMDRMGRSAFGYRSFPNPVDEAAPAPPSVVEPATPPEGGPALFSLIGAALPEVAKAEVAKAEVAPAAVAVPASPFPSQTPMLAQAKMLAHAPMQPPPGPPEIRAAEPRRTSLADMFRTLSGNAGGVPGWRDAGGQEPAFPFRRR